VGHQQKKRKIEESSGGHIKGRKLEKNGYWEERNDGNPRTIPKSGEPIHDGQEKKRDDLSIERKPKGEKRIVPRRKGRRRGRSGDPTEVKENRIVSEESKIGGRERGGILSNSRL